MTFEQRIQDHINASVEASALAADVLAADISSASTRIVQCMLDEGKILCCGNAGSMVHVQHFSSLLLNRYESDRPALPVLALTTANGVEQDDYNSKTVFSRQIRALGHSGDILLAVVAGNETGNILDAIEAAHDRNMAVIALTGENAGQNNSPPSRLLAGGDIEIRIASNTVSHIQEAHLLVIHCLCDLIDYQLFGGE